MARVLIVDDNAAVLRLLGLAFVRMEFEADTATSADEALALARQAPYELAVVDYQLDGQASFDLIRTLREEHPAMTIVLITGYGSMQVAVQAVRAGANEVVEKPITAREIVSRIGVESAAPIDTPSVDRALWEHVTRVLDDCDGNKSETARRLRKPRSWLQRFLDRPAPRF